MAEEAAATPPAAPQGGGTNATPPALVPSQAVNSSNRRNRDRRRGGGGRRNSGAREEVDRNEAATAAAFAASELHADAAEFVPSRGANGSGEKKKKQNRNRQRNRNQNRRQKASLPQDGTTPGAQGEEAPAETGHENSERKPRPAKRRPKKKKGKGGGQFPWRSRIPQGTVDPISLEPLSSLPYPPFALVATEPYVVVKEWPPPPEEKTGESKDEESKSAQQEEERQRRIIEEQWGQKLGAQPTTDTPEAEDKGDAGEEKGERYHHLFDGQVLACYLVSQLQFIDPLNRRDLTRPELENLDAYLKRHRLARAGVTEAYDAKGVTVSSAGVAGQSGAGRAAILQQEATTLLNALFAGDRSGQRRQQQPQRRDRRRAVLEEEEAGAPNRFAQQYAASEARSRPRPPAGGVRNESVGSSGDTGIYAAEHGGMVLIDDDENPGLRGGLPPPSAADAASADGSLGGGTSADTLRSASHIASQSHSARVRADAFPALGSPTDAKPVTETTAATAPSSNNKGGGKPSRSLQRMTKLVSKTKPEEVARQREAREEAQRRALLSNLSFVPPGADGGLGVAPPGAATLPGVAAAASAQSIDTAAQVERNRALASALRVQPSTVRLKTGWARPTVPTITHDEFGNELSTALYPDSLVLAARERMGELLKLERKWKTFLGDDTAASIPLRPMDRPLRTFVHEYSDFWRLQTESFDPEPKRYIHCVKLRDTAVPHPMLSEYARNWKGPGTGARPLPPTATAAAAAAGQSAGHSSREFPVTEQRVPLKLAPRTVPVGVPVPEGAMFDLADVGRGGMGGGGMLPRPLSLTNLAEAGANTRWKGEDRERTKLSLAPRTVPLELPPFEGATRGGGYNVAEERQRLKVEREAEAARRAREEERKKLILERAFESDDEDDPPLPPGFVSGAKEDSESDWEVGEAVYSGSDEEE